MRHFDDYERRRGQALAARAAILEQTQLIGSHQEHPQGRDFPYKRMPGLPAIDAGVVLPRDEDSALYRRLSDPSAYTGPTAIIDMSQVKDVDGVVLLTGNLLDALMMNQLDGDLPKKGGSLLVRGNNGFDEGRFVRFSPEAIAHLKGFGVSFVGTDNQFFRVDRGPNASWKDWGALHEAGIGVMEGLGLGPFVPGSSADLQTGFVQTTLASYSRYCVKPVLAATFEPMQALLNAIPRQATASRGPAASHDADWADK